MAKITTHRIRYDARYGFAHTTPRGNGYGLVTFRVLSDIYLAPPRAAVGSQKLPDGA